MDNQKDKIKYIQGEVGTIIDGEMGPETINAIYNCMIKRGYAALLRPTDNPAPHIITNKATDEDNLFLIKLIKTELNQMGYSVEIDSKLNRFTLIQILFAIFELSSYREDDNG